MGQQTNFRLLFQLDPVFEGLAEDVDKYLWTDPIVCLIKLRTLAEQVTRWVAKREGLTLYGDDSFLGALGALEDKRAVPTPTLEALHRIRKGGNKASHQSEGDHMQAKQRMQDMHYAALWVADTYGDPDAIAPPFKLPPVPVNLDAALKEALTEKAKLLEALTEKAQALTRYEEKVSALRHKLSLPDVYLAQDLSRSLGALPEEAHKRLAVALKAFVTQGGPTPSQPAQPLPAPIDPRLLWVDAPDDAGLGWVIAQDAEAVLVLWAGDKADGTAWAQGRHVAIHPTLGMLQVFREPSARPQAPQQAPTQGAQGPLRQWTDADLIACAVPPLLVPAVRLIQDAQALTPWGAYLPTEAVQALRALLEGQTLAQAQGLAALQAAAHPVDMNNYAAALSHAVSQQQFVNVTEDQDALGAILDAPLEQWRVFLHPDQRKLVKLNAAGPARVLGGAGTGKTVVLMHRVVHLLRDVLPTGKVLVTTFTKNLALDLRANLQRLLTPAELARVEVTHLHRWVKQRLKASGQGGFEVASDVERAKHMALAKGNVKAAKGWTVPFLMTEWQQVVQAQGLTTLSQYLTAKRQGTRAALSVKQRPTVWAVFEGYRKRLAATGRIEWAEAVRRARVAVTNAGPPPYSAVLVDEVQDLDAEALRLLRALTPSGPNDLFMVGDNYQRIYRLPCSFKLCGLHIVGRSYRLRINYRTTERIRALAVSALPLTVDDMNEGQDSLSDYVSLREGAATTYELYGSAQQEAAALVEQVQAWLTACQPEEVCVAARTADLLKRAVTALKGAGIGCALLKDTGLDDAGPGVRVATMHRLKGTEFKRVLLFGVQAGVIPWVSQDLDDADEAIREDFERQERSLFYVAATRARDVLAVMGAGKPSPLLVPSTPAPAEAVEAAAEVAAAEVAVVAEAAPEAAPGLDVGGDDGPWGGLPEEVRAFVESFEVGRLLPLETLRERLTQLEQSAPLYEPYPEGFDRALLGRLLVAARQMIDRLSGERQGTERARRWVQASIRYLVLQDDAAPDFGSAEGLRDDVAVHDAVARALGWADLVLSPASGGR